MPRISSTELNAATERVAPDMLALLADGLPRSKAAITAALAGRHPKCDVQHALARLSVLGRIDPQGCWYMLPAAEPNRG